MKRQAEFHCTKCGYTKCGIRCPQCGSLKIEQKYGSKEEEKK